MKGLSEYIIEAAEKMKATLAWLKEHYREYNKIYFNDELPKNLEINVTYTENLGEQGVHWGYYTSSDYMENGMYRMYKKRKGAKTVMHGKRMTWEDIPNTDYPIKSITECAPYINISSKYVFDEDELEDTLIHEMVHLWTYKDGLAPKIAHGKEFKHKCKEIREKAEKEYGKHYSLMTTATDNSKFEYNDYEKAKELAKQIDNNKNGSCAIYLEFSDEVKSTHCPYPKRFLFCVPKKLPLLLSKIKNADDGKYLTHLYVSMDSSVYDEACKEYGTFKMITSYRFWQGEKYPKMKDIITKTAKDMINESMNEAKKPYVTPMINIVEIPGDINLSNVNMEDIVNDIEKIKNEEPEIKGTKENDKNLIDAE